MDGWDFANDRTREVLTLKRPKEIRLASADIIIINIVILACIERHVKICVQEAWM